MEIAFKWLPRKLKRSYGFNLFISRIVWSFMKEYICVDFYIQTLKYFESHTTLWKVYHNLCEMHDLSFLFFIFVIAVPTQTNACIDILSSKPRCATFLIEYSMLLTFIWNENILGNYENFQRKYYSCSVNSLFVHETV